MTMSQKQQQSKTFLGAISFINTLPVYHLLKPMDDVALVYGPPADLNRQVQTGQLHVSPVSSAYYLRNQDNLILLEDLSVSSFGAVESVLFLSQQPFGQELLNTQGIGVPSDSETSIALLAHLLFQKTGVDFRPWFHMYPAGEVDQALATWGSALVIGDSALEKSENGTFSQDLHQTDLSQLWVKETGLPFVFAVWVARRDFAEAFPKKLAALQKALVESKQTFFTSASHCEEAIQLAQTRCTLSKETLRRYFTHALDFDLTEKHRASLTRFSQAIEALSAPQLPEEQPDTQQLESSVST